VFADTANLSDLRLLVPDMSIPLDGARQLVLTALQEQARSLVPRESAFIYRDANDPSGIYRRFLHAEIWRWDRRLGDDGQPAIDWELLYYSDPTRPLVSSSSRLTTPRRLVAVSTWSTSFRQITKVAYWDKLLES
jgi:hypothetical protein